MSEKRNKRNRKINKLLERIKTVFENTTPTENVMFNGLLSQLQQPVAVNDEVHLAHGYLNTVFNSVPTEYKGPQLKMLFVGSEEDYNKLSQEMKDRFEPYGTRW